MKRILSKISIGISMIVIIGGILVGCGTSNKSVENNPKEAIESFMNFRKSGKLENLKELISDKYLLSQDLNSEQYVQNLKDFDFKNSLEILEYKISDIIDIDENIKKVNVIIKYSDNIVKNGTSEEVYGIIKKDGKWKVSPHGVTDFSAYTYDNEQLKENKLYMYVDKIINLVDGAMLNVKITNNSEYDFSLGWVNPAKAIVETSEGEVVQVLPPAVKITRGMKDNMTIKIDGMKGEIRKVVLTSVHILNNGLPTPGDSGEDIEIFSNNQ